MKKIVLASLMMVCLPYWAMSQSVDAVSYTHLTLPTKA